MKGLKIWLTAVIVMVTVGLVGCGQYKLVKVDETEEAEEVVEEVEEEPEEPVEEVVEEEPEEAEKEEDTEKASQKESTGIASTELSDDIYSFQIQINDEVYQFPMSYDDFVARGWEYDPGTYEEAPEFQPNQYSVSETFKKDGLEVYGIIANFGMNTEPIEKCQVCGVKLDKFDFDKEGTSNVILPGGIEWNVSTVDDIKAAYGDPSDSYDGDLYTSLTYQLDFYQEVELFVYKEENALLSVTVENLVPLDDVAKADTSEVSDEIPDVVKKYVAPTSLGSDLEEFIVEFDGALYKLPCPVSEFEKNGWEIVESDSDSVIKGQSYGWVTIMKNNQQFRTTANNYADDATTISNCFISDLEASEYKANLPMKLCNGLEFGMKKDAAIKILKNEKNLEENAGSSYTEYVIPLLDSRTDHVVVVIYDDKDVVSSLSIDHGYYAEKDFMQ